MGATRWPPQVRIWELAWQLAWELAGRLLVQLPPADAQDTAGHCFCFWPTFWRRDSLVVLRQHIGGDILKDPAKQQNSAAGSAQGAQHGDAATNTGADGRGGCWVLGAAVGKCVAAG